MFLGRDFFIHVTIGLVDGLGIVRPDWVHEDEIQPPFEVSTECLTQIDPDAVDCLWIAGAVEIENDLGSLLLDLKPSLRGET